jgi:hypothetical protein
MERISCCRGTNENYVTDVEAAYVGIHTYEQPRYDVGYTIFINYLIGILYNPILAMVKISVLIFMLRLIGPTKVGLKYTMWTIIYFTGGLTIAIFFCVIFVCDPIAYNWNPTIPGGHCFDRKPFAMWTAGVTIATDLVTVALPFWIFLSLRMNRKIKVAVLFVFAIGLV